MPREPAAVRRAREEAERLARDAQLVHEYVKDRDKKILEIIFELSAEEIDYKIYRTEGGYNIKFQNEFGSHNTLEYVDGIDESNSSISDVWVFDRFVGEAERAIESVKLERLELKRIAELRKAAVSKLTKEELEALGIRS